MYLFTKIPEQKNEIPKLANLPEVQKLKNKRTKYRKWASERALWRFHAHSCVHTPAISKRRGAAQRLMLTPRAEHKKRPLSLGERARSASFCAGLADVLCKRILPNGQGRQDRGTPSGESGRTKRSNCNVALCFAKSRK